MQPYDLSKHANNKNGWKVVHNRHDNLFYIRDTRGHRYNQAFTDRKKAELYLYTRLEKTAETNRKLNERRGS